MKDKSLGRVQGQMDLLVIFGKSRLPESMIFGKSLINPGPGREGVVLCSGIGFREGGQSCLTLQFLTTTGARKLKQS